MYLSISIACTSLLINPGLTLTIENDQSSPGPAPAIFMSLNIEGNKTINDLGISIIQTNHILASVALHKSSVSSYHFRFCRANKRMPKISKPFLFGDSQIIKSKRSQRFFCSLAEGLMDHSCEKGKTPGLTTLFTRGSSQLLIVGHNIRTDMKVIESRCQGFWEMLKPSAVIDLEELCGKVKLRALLEDLGIGAQASNKFLHCARNDSNFALRAVLLSVIRQILGQGAGEKAHRDWSAEYTTGFLCCRAW
jgi:hypothetical protein